MALVKRKVTRPKRKQQQVSRSNTQGEKKEERQPRNQEIAKGKRDADGVIRNTKGIVIRETNKSETKTPKAKGGIYRIRKAYAVKSKYELRTGPKGLGVNASAECEQTTAYLEGKGKEKVTQDLEDLETDSEEVCGRTKIQKTRDDDSDDSDGGGGGGGGEAHTNLSSLCVQLVAAN